MPGSLSQFLRVGKLLRSALRQAAASCGGLVVAAAVLAPASGAAAAAASPVYWVSAAGTSTASDTSCSAAGYSTVQTAVTAAEQDETGTTQAVPTIEICPGTYAGQVMITESLSLTAAPAGSGAGPAVIELPAAVAASSTAGLDTTSNCQAQADQGDYPQSVIEVCAAAAGGAATTGVTVTINGLVVSGPWTDSSCYGSRYGILVEGGATLALTGSTVEKIEASPLNTCPEGVGVEIGDEQTGQSGHGDLSGDTIETYQENGITVDGTGSTASINAVTVTGAGPTPVIAQNGIQFSDGASGSVTDSTVSDNDYTGKAGHFSTGILAFGGGGKSCNHLGFASPLVTHASFRGNKLHDNDAGVVLSDTNWNCTKSAASQTDDIVCGNVITNSHDYPGGQASDDANVSGWSAKPLVGYQAGVLDIGNRDVICDNQVSGPGYAPQDAASSLPNPPGPAFVRPIDTVSEPAINPLVFFNTYDGQPYTPGS